MNKDIEWTPHIIARLTELLAHPDGLSYKLIAKQMAQEFGGKFTRSSISGKIHRLRLPPGPPKNVSWLRSVDQLVGLDRRDRTVCGGLSCHQVRDQNARLVDDATRAAVGYR